MNATECFGLTEIARVTVDETEYVIVDDESFRYAVLAEEYDNVDDRYGRHAVPAFDGHNERTIDAAREHNVERYSLWCAGDGSGVGDIDLCSRIAAAAGIDGMHVAGSCVYVAAAGES